MSAIAIIDHLLNLTPEKMAAAKRAADLIEGIHPSSWIALDTVQKARDDAGTLPMLQRLSQIETASKMGQEEIHGAVAAWVEVDIDRRSGSTCTGDSRR